MRQLVLLVATTSSTCRKKVKLDALAKHVAKVSRKMFEVPEFFYYVIADGSQKPCEALQGLEGIFQTWGYSSDVRNRNFWYNYTVHEEEERKK